MWIKDLHLATVIISFVGFFLRGLLMLRGSPLYWPAAVGGPASVQTAPAKKGPLFFLVRVAPHVNDTLLLAAGVVLALRIHQYPLVHGWLTAKLVGLLIYIALGMVALRFGRSLRVRRNAWLAALLVYLYIVAVALTRDPLLGLAQLT
jgi:uncharacterized membrane protein SirB2